VAGVNEEAGNDQRRMRDLCETSAVPTDAGLRIAVAGRDPVAVFRVGSEYFVIDDTCTHGNGSLAEGETIGYEVACPYHFGRFCLRTGQPTAPPCVAPVRTYRSEIREGRVYAALEDGGHE
jgi:nitrite reductase/ring-hydroxylating ferredoxin subunit